MPSAASDALRPTAPPRAALELPRDPFTLPASVREPHVRSIFALPLHLPGNVTEMLADEAPNPQTFFSVYAPTLDAQQRSPACAAAAAADKTTAWRACGDIGRGTPILFRSLAATMPAFDAWSSDARLRRAYTRLDDFGPPPVLRAVEKGPRRENRKVRTVDLPLPRFLDSYRRGTADEALYSVSPLPDAMAAHVHLPPWLRCGGGARRMRALNLWMSSGGTESVVHTDPYDNLNCVFAGRKRFLLIDSRFYPLVSHPECGWYDAEKQAAAAGDTALPEEARRLRHGYGSFSGINVSAVDLRRWPCWAHLPFREATLEAGDCLFIPQHTIHHVASDGGEGGRSVAFNLWWRRPERLDMRDCLDGQYGDEPIPASDCAFETWGDEMPRPEQPACSRARGAARRRSVSSGGGSAAAKEEL